MTKTTISETSIKNGDQNKLKPPPFAVFLGAFSDAISQKKTKIAHVVEKKHFSQF